MRDRTEHMEGIAKVILVLCYKKQNGHSWSDFEEKIVNWQYFQNDLKRVNDEKGKMYDW